MLTAETHAKLTEFADAHQAADEYVAGTYYDGPNRGCAIGCAIKDCQKLGLIGVEVNPNDHAALAEATGLPEMVLRLADYIFERVPTKQRSHWPPRLWRAVRPGVDYSRLPARIMARVAMRLADTALRADVRAASLLVASLWARLASGNKPRYREWVAARQQVVEVDWPPLEEMQAYAQAYAMWCLGDAALMQTASAPAVAVMAQTYSVQAGAAREEFWTWCADVVCEELARRET